MFLLIGGGVKMAKTNKALGHQAEEILKDMPTAEESKKLFKGAKKNIAEFTEWLFKSIKEGATEKEIDMLSMHLTSDLDREFLDAVYEESIDDEGNLVDFNTVPAKIDNTFMKEHRMIANPFKFDNSKLIEYSKSYDSVQELLSELAKDDVKLRERFDSVIKSVMMDAIKQDMLENPSQVENKAMTLEICKDFIDAILDKKGDQIFNMICAQNPILFDENLSDEEFIKVIADNLDNVDVMDKNFIGDIIPDIAKNAITKYVGQYLKDNDVKLTRESAYEFAKIIKTELLGDEKYIYSLLPEGFIEQEIMSYVTDDYDTVEVKDAEEVEEKTLAVIDSNNDNYEIDLDKEYTEEEIEEIYLTRLKQLEDRIAMNNECTEADLEAFDTNEVNYLTLKRKLRERRC